jgi:pyruvate/2-oxoglutarate dehydrogenase complex dihydrolipoamide acyltransferase (E2) component
MVNRGRNAHHHQILCATISFDHDIVDGAPAARFAQTLKELIEGQAVLDELIGPGSMIDGIGWEACLVR